MRRSDGGFISRLERFARLDSTQRVVARWLAEGTPEVALAVADEQSAGRGRHGRSWTAPPGAALLLSLGLRPPGLPLRHGWRLAAVVGLAMAEAAEQLAGLPQGSIGLKWPNDLVAVGGDGEPRKLAGVLGETSAEGDRVAAAVVGIGVNVDWARDDFPPQLADGMTSLRELSGAPVDREALLAAFLERLEPAYRALTAGRFDGERWAARQVTTGRRVEVATGPGESSVCEALGVDTESGALIVIGAGERRTIDSGEVVRCRIA
ncbi:MAG TPA: biotin--[acetyl-CoA-carboxylase] ligase [Candidatus Limnocylindrales bacterium]|nr:biotin--[acetyl-CoA-carboxylase] ligase [Candidatus Limnocylindrales bacterium]